MNFMRNIIVRLLDTFYREPRLIGKYYRQKAPKQIEKTLGISSWSTGV